MALNILRFAAVMGLAGLVAFPMAACGDSEVTDREPEPEEVRPIEERPVESWNFLDEHGRVLILRGANLAGVSKGPTGLPGTPEETAVDAEHFKELGFNAVRYLIQWKNIEPAKGEYDYEYLETVRSYLDLFHEQGVYVVLDMHQDVYGPRFGFNGAPDWAVEDDGIEFVPASSWFANYFSPAVQRAFDNFFAYDTHSHLQDAFAAMWKVTATELGDHPAVIGFDLINEPHPGTKFDLAEFGRDRLNQSSHFAFDQEHLGPFYQRVINAIREVDTDTWILFEPRYGAPGDGAKSYLPFLKDPREGNRRLFQAPHLYVLAVEATPVYGNAAQKRVAKWETERRAERDAGITGVWLGEFGTFEHVDGHQKYMEDVLAITERMRIGFAAWSWDSGEFGMIGPRDPETLRHSEGVTLDYISRPYPRAFAGVPTAFSFDPETDELTVEWTVDHSIDAPTEVFLSSERTYEGYVAYKLEGLTEDQATMTVEGEILSITITDESVTTAKLVVRPDFR